MWVGIAALAFALCALSFSVFLYLELRTKVSAPDISSALRSSSEELNKNYEKSYRALEAEWLDMYSKFTRLAGRMDKTKGLDAAKATTENEAGPEPAPLTQSEVYRRWRRQNR